MDHGVKKKKDLKFVKINSFISEGLPLQKEKTKKEKPECLIIANYFKLPRIK